jgi:hypothetical protein
MRLHFGPPPPDLDFHPEVEGWTKLREPTPILLQLLALPIAALTLVILVAAWGTLNVSQPTLTLNLPTDVTAAVTKPPADWLIVAGFAAGFLVLIVVHELLHAVGYPGGIFTHRTSIGIWPAKFLCYAGYIGSISRNRFLYVFALPFLVLTILPLLVATAMQASPYGLAAVSIVNGVFSCGDLLLFVIIAWQIPRTATVRNQGWGTWWKIV